MSIQPYTINVPQSVLDDLRTRLSLTRWPDEIPGVGWGYGTNPDYLRSLVAYWQEGFDWRAQETKLNEFAHYRAQVNAQTNDDKGEVGIHFIHERGKGPNPMPLLLIHGWPDSFHRMVKIIPMLTNPARFGGDPADSFDVIMPSIPGYGFSDRPTAPGMNSVRIAELFTRLMSEELGYERFAVAGGDMGSRITRLMAVAHPERITGIHMTDIGFRGDVSFPAKLPDALTPVEQQYLGASGWWFMSEGAYIMFQGTKPQTLAYGLNDSPVALAGWIVEKFQAWSDCDGDVEQRFSKDELLTNIMIYWATQTINSSIRLYAEDGRTQPVLQPGQLIEVPAGVAIFLKEMAHPPRQLGERFLRIQRWTETDRGGHFSAFEEPELLAEEMRKFYRPLR